MNSEDSRNLVDAFDRKDVDRPEIRGLLSRYFRENKFALWSDALDEHALLSD